MERRLKAKKNPQLAIYQLNNHPEQLNQQSSPECFRGWFWVRVPVNPSFENGRSPRIQNHLGNPRFPSSLGNGLKWTSSDGLG
jgi:hypothetical protein